MITILCIAVGWFSGAAFVVLTMNLVAGLNGRRYRRPGLKVETVFRSPPAGPAQDALRAVKLRAYLDKTEPRA